jgi:hypothetical protein
MALGALNVFKTVTSEVTTSANTIYTAPTGYTGIVLMAQISNIAEETGNVTFSLISGNTTTELLKNFDIPKNDAISGTVGKLVIGTGNSVSISAGANNTLKLVLSILESANE